MNEKLIKIESFKVNHKKLLTGLYVSRIDEFNGAVVTTFDLRFITPNKETPMNISGMHTIEHLFATYLRNSEIKDKIVYFGPMGCRTGFYLLTFGRLTPNDIMPFVLSACEYTLNYKGKIPGASKIECGNYKDHDLPIAKLYAEKYMTALKNNPHTVYPE